MVPEPVRFVSDPPVTVTPDRPKVGRASLSVKVMVAVSPIFRAALLLAIEMAGTAVSIVSDGVNWPATFALPAESVKVLAAIETRPGAVELAVGVKTAV